MTDFWETRRVSARPSEEHVNCYERDPGNPTLLRFACSPLGCGLNFLSFFLSFPQISSGHEPNGWSHKCVPQMFQRREGKRAALLCTSGAAALTGARSLRSVGSAWRRSETLEQSLKGREREIVFLRRGWCAKTGTFTRCRLEGFPRCILAYSRGPDSLGLRAWDSHCQLRMCRKSTRRRGRSDGCCGCVTPLCDTSGCR